ncbi:YhcN/YlaJ family sporulation lipoprotein [Virgibacillus natechei]|uniref:YhcN/YlaJ family sporulation lipoprotein n=1 Tax=Virgibacillus natechei TaxID=1216297 RepID=A0ABS4IGU8_9BACI|nr:YhcN/YlaJ family sporulation lipoprotein [Virgibacillus natechei]MBP1970155.1 YhcN/YlaJ family sporulation lipoprotein [Virgibacillus natechei]UZD14226.1 YhcN/YlaJ family sporulation lipoprotein [Virgibacillus natechei]
MKWKLFSALAVLIIALGACGNVDDGTQDQEGATGTNNVEQTRYNDNTGTNTERNTGEGMTGNRDHTMERNADRNQNRNPNQINNNQGNTNQGQGNDRFDVAEEAADQITNEVDEIDQAYVLTTDNNAYVAAGLDTDNRERNDQEGGQNGTTNQGGTTGNQMNDGNTNNQDNNDRFDDAISDDVREEIEDIVTSVDNDINNVYVSTNPEFFDLTNNYVDDVNQGEPIQGFFDQFNNMVERIFPNTTN